jgi:tetratricopeptide (TPR) repeat protein
MNQLPRFWGIRELEEPENQLVARLALFWCFAAILLRILFWAYTGRVWEDALITALHSENFVRGLGLTHFRVGEAPLHGFTSPLSVLVPLLGDLLKPGWGLSAIKIASIIAAPLTILFAAGFFASPGIRLPAPLTFMVMGYLACEHHQILWGMSGMETQLAELALIASAYYAVSKQQIRLGFALGFCMLARPDFAFWTALIGIYAFITSGFRVWRAVFVATAVYAPWIIFATAYYGSPIPNTIIAKSLGYPLWTHDPLFSWRFAEWNIWKRVTGAYMHDTIFQPLGPSFAGHGQHFRELIRDHGIICNAMIVMAIIGAADALRKRQWPWLLPIGFVTVYAFYYVFFVPVVFSWYVVPFVAMALSLSARGIQAVTAPIGNPKFRAISQTIFAIVYLSLFIIFLPKTFETERQIQNDIENTVRRKVGEYLAENMRPNEAVGCEPLGYIGYYSRRTVYDWPGLASRKVVGYSRSHPEQRSLIEMLEAIRPEYIVLRFSEYSDYFFADWLDADYRIVASFEAAPQNIRKIFGVRDNVDLGFLILARRDISPANSDNRKVKLGSRAIDALGDRLARQDKLRDALECYNEALQLDPNYAEGHNDLGMLSAGLGNMETALKEVGESVKLDPDYAVGFYNLGLLNESQGRTQESEALYRKAIEAKWDYLPPHNSLGKLLGNDGKLNEALHEFNRVLALDPLSDEGRFNMAVTLMKLGRNDEAEWNFQEALRINPKYRQAYEALRHSK